MPKLWKKFTKGMLTFTKRSKDDSNEAPEISSPVSFFSSVSSQSDGTTFENPFGWNIPANAQIFEYPTERSLPLPVPMNLRIYLSKLYRDEFPLGSDSEEERQMDCRRWYSFCRVFHEGLDKPHEVNRWLESQEDRSQHGQLLRNRTYHTLSPERSPQMESSGPSSPGSPGASLFSGYAEAGPSGTFSLHRRNTNNSRESGSREASPVFRQHSGPQRDLSANERVRATIDVQETGVGGVWPSNTLQRRTTSSSTQMPEAVQGLDRTPSPLLPPPATSRSRNGSGASSGSSPSPFLSAIGLADAFWPLTPLHSRRDTANVGSNSFERGHAGSSSPRPQPRRSVTDNGLTASSILDTSPTHELNSPLEREPSHISFVNLPSRYPTREVVRIQDQRFLRPQFHWGQTEHAILRAIELTKRAAAEFGLGIEVSGRVAGGQQREVADCPDAEEQELWSSYGPPPDSAVNTAAFHSGG